MNRTSVIAAPADSATPPLGAPIFVRDEVTACIYATHRQVDNLFGDDERRLAEFITTLAGAALENAQGFAQLKDLTATLEQRVKERTEQIERQNEVLASQQQELARSNQELEQFAYVASHDLQEPLRTVASYCQLLARQYKGQLDDEADEFIDHAVAGAMRMKTLISDLLAYSRVGTHGKPFERTDCNQILAVVRENLKVMIEERAAVVTADDLPTVLGDRTQLTQLFQNLIGNGIKFQGVEPPRIHVGVERDGDHWKLSVRDNGIGIASKHHERIFNIFQRLHTRKEYSGTGIGLAVCKRTVERHGGRIWVESEAGRGSKFIFTFPVLQADDA